MRNVIPSHIFRAYDIRGLADTELTDSVAETLGRAIGTYLQLKSGRKIVVGRDNRVSSERLKRNLVKGLMATGCEVIDIDLCTSPMFYVAALQWKQDGGVMVTGSHNPKQYNGFKIVGKNAFPVQGTDLTDFVMTGKFIEGEGKYKESSILDEYITGITRRIHLAKKLKVAVDTGNGVAGIVVPNVLRKLGCEVVEVFTELDGNFPNHLPNPEVEESLNILKQRVISTNSDVGFGFDGDGDRIGLVDEKGNFLPADYLIMLLARDYLTRNPKNTVLVDVKISQNAIDDISKRNGNVLLYKTGHSLVKQKMREDNIELGGELSGHMFVFEDYHPIDDALFAACKILQYLALQDLGVSQQFTDLPKLYASPLIEIHCEDNRKFEVVKQLQSYFKEAKYEVNTIDGARVTFPMGWAIVRASNTTPSLTLRFEANSSENLEHIRQNVTSIVESFLIQN